MKGDAVEILLATGNKDKIREIEAIMALIDVTLVRPDEVGGIPVVVEDGRTLEENALKKAREIRDFTGLCALADDTALEVDALGGAPGIYSSRFAGENASYDDNNRKLIRELAGVPLARRSARFRCVMALALLNKIGDELYNRMSEREGLDSDLITRDEGSPEALVTEGILEGRIALESRGTGGFGFDPLFDIPSV